MFSQSSTTPHNRDTNKKLVKIIHGLLELDQSAPFRKPVPHKALGLGDYKKIVKKPIDLNQIRRQNNQSKYKTIEQALDDIQLCWQNCKLYNHASSEVYQQALNLEKIFWKMVQQNFPDIYSATELKLKVTQGNDQMAPVTQNKKAQSIYEASQSQQAMKQQKQAIQESSQKNMQAEPQQSRNSRMQDQNNQSQNEQQNENKSQKSSQKQQMKQPIFVSLKQRPTLQNIARLTTQMKTIEDKSILQQVLQILFTYQKQNLISSPKGQMHFKIQNIHLSTYHRICKIIKLDTDQMLEIIQ